MPFIFDSVWIESKSHKLFELFSTLKSYRSEDVQSTSSKYARVRTKNAQSDATFESNKSNVSYINRWSFQFPLRVWHKPLKILFNPNFHQRIENKNRRLWVEKFARNSIIEKFSTSSKFYLFWGYAHLCRFGWKILLESPLIPCWVFLAAYHITLAGFTTLSR